MTCPRGNHGRLVQETYPISHYCPICGYREYPVYERRLGDEAGYAPRPHMSAKQKEAQYKVVHGLIEKGYSNPEIESLTGYTRGTVESAGTRARREIKKQLDNLGADDYN